MRRRPAPASRRVYAALLASLWMFGLLASLWHGPAEEHVYCAEHGTFEEAGAKPSAPAPQADQVGDGDGAEQRDEHEACAFFDAGAIATLGDERPVSDCVLLSATPPASIEASPAYSPIALLHLAPKGSPPASVVSLFLA